ncbi:MAG: GntR family transcriptional regulator [Hyphomicrobiales bacterium]|nr:GntR family transcriptional regulator [Hyphomicrobiales bacterium]
MASRARAGRDGQGTRARVIQRIPIHDQVLPHIRRDIVENRWKPGSRLPEPALCDEFGISRTPLRQALKSLEAEGLVRLVPNVGAVVTDPDEVDLKEKMELLIALEQFAAAQVAGGDELDVKARIASIYRSMRDAANRRRRSRYFELNYDFHRAIVQGTRNATLIALHENVMMHVERERHRANASEPFSMEAAKRHEHIVRHMLARDAQAAGRAMREHLEYVKDLMLAQRRSGAAVA